MRRSTLATVAGVLVVSLVLSVWLYRTDPMWLLMFSRGEVSYTSASPDGDWKLTFYRRDPGATGAEMMWAKAVNSDTGKSRYVYYDDTEVRYDIVWLSDVVVEINGHKLDLRYDSWEAPSHD